MSFSKDVKDEVRDIIPVARHCQLALLSAVLNLCCVVDKIGNETHLSFNNDNIHIYNLTKELLQKLFDFKIEYTNESYLFTIKDTEVVHKILSSTGVLAKKNVNGFFLKRTCCKKQFIKGVFLICGSLSDPEKTYHLEFVFKEKDFAEDFLEVINYFGLNSKVIKRKNNFVTYVKDSGEISDFLKIIFASNALMDFENIRIMKDMRNNTNRVVNCEAENIKKTVSAANFHIENILLIKKEKGISFLTDDLQKIAELRLKHDHSSLKELGELSIPKISKASVNYKLKKISKIADDIRGGVT